jgi:hypothetical protein
MCSNVDKFKMKLWIKINYIFRAATSLNDDFLSVKDTKNSVNKLKVKVKDLNGT